VRAAQNEGGFRELLQNAWLLQRRDIRGKRKARRPRACLLPDRQLSPSDSVPWTKPTAQERVMRNAGTHSGKDLAHEIALLKRQLDDLSSSLTDSGESILSRGEAVLGTVKKAKDTLIEQTETRPLTTLAAVAGIGFLAGWLYRRD
jgi:ElaB/YqjD/DUF883 family membrane-anchored ribosome-binding protein